MRMIYLTLEVVFGRPWRRLRSATSDGMGRVGAHVHSMHAVHGRESGQTVAEYALVLLVAAAIATAFLLWARQSGRLDAFFDAIFERLLNSVDSE